jgi:hypothetical protein
MFERARVRGDGDAREVYEDVLGEVFQPEQEALSVSRT